MVDRGGLNYTIKIKDQFSKTTKLFREEMRLSKKAARDFQASLTIQRKVSKELKEAAGAARELAREQEKLAAATRKTKKPLTDQEKALRRLAAAEKLQRAKEKESIRLRNRQAGDARRRAAALRAAALAEEKAARVQDRRDARSRRLRRGRDSELQARKKVNAELFRKTVLLKQIESLQRRGTGLIAQGGEQAIIGQALVRRAEQLRKSMVGASKATSTMFFTFRRLIGTLAVFTLARRGVRAFNDLVVSGIKFNDTIEASTIGIAGLVATLGDVRNELGQSVTAGEELGLAMGVAREQIAKLRQDSLRTVATFTQLLDTFQVSVGPGLAAGLALDEVRQLTVDISQAASALGVPQNQLAEEVRSLLSGTIQARTTRIATALGISNDDIRRLKETGELFEFLEEKFSSFAEAAQRQARETLGGITTLVRGLVQEVLGNAAQPLFAELVDLGNQLFDEVLSIRDEAGNIRPNPEVVKAFKELFNALRDGVRTAREFGENLGFEGLQTLLGSIGFGFQILVGLAETFLFIFTKITNVLGSVRDLFSETNAEASEVGQSIGRITAAVITLVTAVKLLNTQLLITLRRPAAIAAVFVAVGAAIQAIIENLFDVDLSIRDTIKLVVLGLVQAWTRVSGVVAAVAINIVTFMENALDKIISAAIKKSEQAKSLLTSFFGSEDALIRQDLARQKADLALEIRIADRKKKAEEILAAVRAASAERQLKIENEIAFVIGGAARRETRGSGADPAFFDKDTIKATEGAANVFVSTVDKSITKLAESLIKVNDELVKARLEFELAQGVSGVGGLGSELGDLGIESAIAGSERLKEVRADLFKTEEDIAVLRNQGFADTAGALVTKLRDQADLLGAINIAEEARIRLLRTQQAIVAQEALPGLQEENALLNAQLAQQQALTAARVNDVGARQMAVVTAEAALKFAQAELGVTRAKALIQIQGVQAEVAASEPGEELDILKAFLAELVKRKVLEDEILQLRIKQLEKAKEEAELVANGSLTEGLVEGFEAFAEQFSSTFNAGLEIAKQSTAALASFISTSIVDAFDPTKDKSLIERFAQFMQQVASIILQQLIQLAIAKSILKITTSFNEGGEVPGFNKGGPVRGRHGSRFPRGYASGGPSISPLDTVPAFLQPGEFVMRKSAVDAIGLDTMAAMNRGNFAVAGGASAEAAGPAVGMQTGGLVADQIRAEQGQVASSEGGGGIVLPVLVADDREMDQLTAGGKNAFMNFVKDNAGDIRSLIDRGASRR